MALIGKNLIDHYKTFEMLMSHYNWNPYYIDNMIPFEMVLYNGLLINRRREAQIIQSES